MARHFDPAEYADIEAIGLRDPRIAYWLRSACAKGKKPQSFLLQSRFVSGAVDQPVPLVMDTILPEDFFVTEFSYDVDSNAFAGSILEPTYRKDFALNPGISITLAADGGFLGDQYNLNITLTPVQNMLAQAQNVTQPCRWPAGWALLYGQQASGTAVLVRAPAASAVPITLSVVMKGMPLGCKNYNGLDMDAAIDKLLTEFDMDIYGRRSVDGAPRVDKKA